MIRTSARATDRLLPLAPRSLGAPATIALQFPFAECHPSSGFVSEDWHWHCEMLAAGVSISAVEGTTFFHRRRPGTRPAIHIQTHAVLRPTQLFDPSGLRRFGIRLTSPEVEATTPTEEDSPNRDGTRPPSFLTQGILRILRAASAAGACRYCLSTALFRNIPRRCEALVPRVEPDHRIDYLS